MKRSDDDNTAVSAPEQLLEEVELLVWQLLDDELDDQQFQRLESLLLDRPEARATYVNCMQMHADLQFMFNDKLRNSPLPPPSSRLPAAVVNALPIATAQMPLV